MASKRLAIHASNRQATFYVIYDYLTACQLLVLAFHTSSQCALTTQSRGPPHVYCIQVIIIRRLCVGPLFWLLGIMKFIIVLALILTSGCTTLDRYNIASTTLMHEEGSGSFNCWREPGPYKPMEFINGVGRPFNEDCKDKEAQSDVKLCINKLRNAAVEKPSIAQAKENLLECMQDRGWVRYEYVQIIQ